MNFNNLGGYARLMALMQGRNRMMPGLVPPGQLPVIPHAAPNPPMAAASSMGREVAPPADMMQQQSPMAAPGMVPGGGVDRDSIWERLKGEFPGKESNASRMLIPMLMTQVGAALMADPDQRGAILSKLPEIMLATQKLQQDQVSEKARIKAYTDIYGPKKTGAGAEFDKEWFFNPQTQEHRQFPPGSIIPPGWARAKQAAEKPISTDQMLAEAIQSGNEGEIKRLIEVKKAIQKEPQPKSPTLLENEAGELVAWNPGMPLAGLKKPVSSAYAVNPDDQDALLDGVEKGLVDPNQVSKRGINPVLAKAAKRGLNIGQIKQDWKSSETLAKTMNNTQMVRFDTLSNTVMGTIDRVIDLSEQLKLSGVPLYNVAKLAEVRNLEGNSPKGQLIGQYMAAITTLKEEYANFAQGGYAPTESAFKLGDMLIKENYGSQYMRAALEETRRLVNIRRNAFKNVVAQRVAGPGNTLSPSPQPAKDLKSMSTEELKALRDKLKGGQ